MMWTLIKKDIRLNLIMILGGLVFSILPYALTVTNVWVNPPRYRPVQLGDYISAIEDASVGCMVIMVILSAAFGGMAFAFERRERTAEFLAMMPTSRSKIALSKVVVAIAWIALFLTPHIVILFMTNFEKVSIGLMRRPDANLAHYAQLAVTYTIIVFSSAWAMSVFLRSPAISASIAIVVGFGFLFGATVWIHRILEDVASDGRASEKFAFGIAAWLGVLFTLVAAALSTVRYVRRVQP